MTIRNIGIFAHVDTGKTTLSEKILFHAGAIRKAGSVDQGTAHTDTLPVEQRRGISVKATCVRFQWKDTTVNLIDTPGHTDFSAEIERSIWPLDGAIVLVDAVDGIQPQTEVLFNSLQHEKIPVLFFINKTDREGADITGTFTQIRKALTPDAVLVNDAELLTDLACNYDDALLERYLDGEKFSTDFLQQQIIPLVHSGKCHPVLFGSALKDEGIQELLDAVVKYLPPPEAPLPDLCGVVFSCVADKIMGRGLLVRLFGGHLENRMTLAFSAEMNPFGQGTQEPRKITQIRDISGNDTGALDGGDIGVVYGLADFPIGYVFGKRELLPRNVHLGALRSPLINVQILPEKPDDMRALHTACLQLAEEDPLLKTTYIPALNQLQMNIMGVVQLEILQDILQTRYGLNVSFSEPSVIYKETVAKSATGFVDYTMPKPCWAIMTFLVEPAPRGSGVTFTSNVSANDILLRYQHQVEQAIPMSLEQGRLGWEVTDVKITLVSGEHHLEHTHPMDFIVATPMGIQDALKNAGSQLLEPILEVNFMLPQEHIGRVISDVNKMRGEVLDSETHGDKVLLRALLPVSTSISYPTTLAMITSGKGAMNFKLHSYRECPEELGKSSPRRSIDPLDKAKYILAVRKALE